MTLYSDSSCQHAISGTENMGLLMDSGCNALVASYNKHIGSYKASNTSAIIGGAIAGSFLLLSLCICGCCLCRKCANKQQEVKSTVPNAYNPPIPYLTNANYSAPPTIQQPYYSNVPDYVTNTQPVYYPQPQYYPVYYPPQPIAPIPSAPPTYNDYPSKTAI